MPFTVIPFLAPDAAGGHETFVWPRWDDAGLVPLADQQSGAQAPLVKAG